VKKTQRSSSSGSGKGKGKSVNKGAKAARAARAERSAGKAGGKAGATLASTMASRTVGTGRGQAPGRKPPERIPVRGARKSKVKARPPEEAAAPIRNKADLAETRALAIAAMEAAVDKRGLDPVLIDVSAMGSYTDFIGVVSGRSDRQVDAIAESVSATMKAGGRPPLGREGTGTGRWTLLDFGAFVIHVFYHPVREFYDLESLWIEAPRVKLDVPPEATLSQPDAFYGAL
jgi:ribosome-associated protein